MKLNEDVSNYVASEASKRYGRKLGLQNAIIEANGDLIWYDKQGNKKRRKAKTVDPIFYETEAQARQKALKNESNK
jgi:hypothetical protein